MTTQRNGAAEGAVSIIDSVRQAEDTALEAVRKFVEAVDEVFPDLSVESPRHKIIESAFKMTEQLLGASNDLATRLVKTTSSAADSKAGTGGRH